MHHRPSYWQWLLWTVALVLIAASAVLALYIIRHKRRQLQKETEEGRFRKEQWERELIRTRQMHDQLRLEHARYNENLVRQFEQNCLILRSSDDLERDICWKDFDRMCQIIDSQLFMLAGKLRQRCVLSEREVRLCILVMLDVSYRQMLS